MKIQNPAALPLYALLAEKADRETMGAPLSEASNQLSRSAATGNGHEPAPVLRHSWHASAGLMSNSRGNAGTVNVDGVFYDWHLQREPHLSDDEGWKGMTISILQQDAKREALVEFPPPKRLLKGLPRGRLQLDDATISRCVRAAISAGWEPMSRGRPVVFMVDADGN